VSSQQPPKQEKAPVGLAEPVGLPLWGALERLPSPAAGDTTALLVFHGIGQQVPFETLDMIAQAVIDEHVAAGGIADKRVRHVWCEDGEGGRFIPRAEIELQRVHGDPQYVHVYESYWAPMTEGAIGLWATLQFYFGAGVDGLLSTLRNGRRFERWAFGGERWFPLDFGTPLHLLAALFVLAVLAAVLLAGTYVLWPEELAPPIEWSKVYKALPSIVPFGILAWGIWSARRLVIQFFGDVAIYLSPDKVDRHWRIRDEIKRHCCRITDNVYRAVSRGSGGTRWLYGKIVVTGHSLGSVIAYDCLNALVQRDIAKGGDMRVGVAARTASLLTFGSPLDKVAFIFGTKITGRRIREALAGGMQPLIVNYEYRPPAWVNIHAPGDIIAGRLDYYDHPDGEGTAKRVRNLVDAEAGWFFVTAHTGYWEHRVFRSELYAAIAASSAPAVAGE
jgi:hypothetical protein